MKFCVMKSLVFVILLILLSCSCVRAQIASDASFLMNPTDETGVSSEKSESSWKIKPGMVFRWKRKGIDWSVGPRLGISKRVSEAGSLTLNLSVLPVRYSELRSGSRLDYWRFDAGYRYFVSKKLFIGAGFGVHRFEPSDDFTAEIAARGGDIVSRTITSASLSAGYQVFKIAWSFRGRQRIWPFFLEASWQQADDYDYGVDIGSAGSEFKIKSGFSFRIRPMSARF